MFDQEHTGLKLPLINSLHCTDSISEPIFYRDVLRTRQCFFVVVLIFKLCNDTKVKLI